MSTTTTVYKHGINTLTPSPTGDGGQYIDNNFRTIGDLFDNTGDVTSVAGRTGVVVLSAGDISGLGSAATTSTAAYDVAGAAATVSSSLTTTIATKLSLAGGTMTGNISFGDSYVGTDGAGGLLIHDAGNDVGLTFNNAKLTFVGGGSGVDLNAGGLINTESIGFVSGGILGDDEEGGVSITGRLSFLSGGIDVGGSGIKIGDALGNADGLGVVVYNDGRLDLSAMSLVGNLSFSGGGGYGIGNCDHISNNNLGVTIADTTGLIMLSGPISMHGHNILSDTITGTKIGTATNQKISFYNSPPIVQPSGDISTALSNLGLVATPTIGLSSTTTKLATARNINGVAFDGSASITVAAAAGTLTGSTLAAGVTASSLTTLGTLSSQVNLAANIGIAGTNGSGTTGRISLVSTGGTGILYGDLDNVYTGYTVKFFVPSGGLLFYTSSGSVGISVNNAGVFMPVQATTTAAPSYTKGGVYFDTTLNKLRVGGASAWETVSSS